MEERGNGKGRDRSDRGRGEHRGRRDDRGRGNRQCDPEGIRRPGQEYNPRGHGNGGFRGRTFESRVDDRPAKKPRFDDGAGPSSAGPSGTEQFSDDWSRPGPSSAGPSSTEQFSGDRSRTGPSSEGSTLMPSGFGRGRGRGRRRMEEVVVCRPTNITDTRSTVNGPYSKIITNYFKAKSTPNWKVFQYHTYFDPEVDNTRLKRAFVHAVKEHLGVYIFDGMNLFTIQRLGDAEEFVALTKRLMDDVDIKITFKLVKEVSSADPILLKIFNDLLRKCFRNLKLQQFNRNYFDPFLAVSIAEHNLELWPGFISAISRYQSSVLMHADLTFKVLRTDNVLEQLNEVRKNNPSNYHDVAIRLIVGCIVLTRYNNRTYRIDDIAWDKSPMSTFPTKEGNELSFMDYYQNHWRLTIRNDSQPLLISHPRERDQNRGLQGDILLVPELTFMTGLSETTRQNFRIMRAIASHTRLDPGSRVRKLKEIMSRIQSNPQSQVEMNNWNLTFDKDLLVVKGRVLKSEKIIQGENVSYEYDRNKSDWTNKLQDKPMFRSVACNRWLLIYSKDHAGTANKFGHILNEVCSPMGIGLAQPEMISINGDSARAYVEAIKSRFNPSVQLVVCLLFKQLKDRYDAIKKVCCIDCPVPSQVVTKKVIDTKNLKSVATKIGIQINCKLGGAPWTLNFPMKTSKIMVVGYDAYRDSSRRGTSVGALCCSLDQGLTKYYSRVCFQSGETEMIDGLVENFAAALKRYKSLNGNFPDKIFFYRDGVSQGQLLSIRDNELSRILETFKQLGISKQMFAFIVVSKRINTRLMEDRNGQIVNPKPGTVVDRGITRKEWYDFFLVSQSVNQGTVSPTHFNIIYDTTELEPDHMQRFTYKLTHLYFNWPGTVRVPAPCVYAYKLAFLTSQSLHAPHSEQLADSLFFL